MREPVEATSVEDLVSRFSSMPSGDRVWNAGVGSRYNIGRDDETFYFVENKEGQEFCLSLRGVPADAGHMLSWTLSEAIKKGPEHWREVFLDPDVSQGIADFAGVKDTVKRTPKVATCSVEGSIKIDAKLKVAGVTLVSDCPRCHKKARRGVSPEWLQQTKANEANPFFFHCHSQGCGWYWKVDVLVKVELVPWLWTSIIVRWMLTCLPLPVQGKRLSTT